VLRDSVMRTCFWFSVTWFCDENTFMV